MQTVKKFQTRVVDLQFRDSFWELSTTEEPIYTKNAILCTGAEPKNIPSSSKIVPLDIALHPEKLKQAVSPRDRIAVFGASHSAVLSIANALKAEPAEVIQFFRSPHTYAKSPFDSGLRGPTAAWARTHLDEAPSRLLKRVSVESPQFQEELAKCSHVISAIGFSPRKLLPEQEQHEKGTGMLGYGLYGLGIGFPLVRFNADNQRYAPATLQSFVRELDLLLPLWFAYANRGSYPEFPWNS